MGSLDLRICAQLDDVCRLKAKQIPQALSLLRRTYTDVVRADEACVRTAFNNGDMAGYDVYLYCAEQAVALAEWAVVEGCLERLAGLPLDSMALQCRLLFVQSQYYSKQSLGCVGEALVDAVQTSSAKALKGIHIALQDKAQLSHLVVQGTKHCWNAIRVLYRQGTAALLLPILKDINAAFEAIGYSNWHSRVVWLLRQAVVELAAGRDAKSSVQNALGICDKNSLDSLRTPLKRVQLALKMDSSKGAAGGILKGIAACQTVYSKLAEEKDQAQELLAAYQDLASTTLVGTSLGKKPTKLDKGGKPVEGEVGEREEVLAEVGLLAALHPLPALSEDPAGDKPKERSHRYRLFKCYSEAVKVCEAEGGTELTKDHFPAGEIGQMAVDNMLPAVAKDASQKALRASSLKARVLAEYTTAVLFVQEAGGLAVQKELYGNRCTAEMTTIIAAGIRGIVKALSSALRTDDIHVVQLGCILAWNMSLPLLSATKRGMVSKSLQQVHQALEAVGSNLHRLKVQLLYELALADVAEEYLVKANTKVAQALREDYVVDEEEEKLYNLARPLDRLLVPLKERLDLKANIYYVPDSSSTTNAIEKEKITREEVILLLDRARETRQLGLVLHTLQRAVELLTETEPPAAWLLEDRSQSVSVTESPKGAKKKKSVTEEGTRSVSPSELIEDNRRRDVLRQRAALWARIVTIADDMKSHKMADLMINVLPMVMDRKWTQQAERQLRIDQVQACLACASVEKKRLEGKGFRLGQREFVDANGDSIEPSEEVRHRAEVLRTQDAINKHVTDALGHVPSLLKDKDNWLAANIVITFLNWHAGVLAAHDFIYHFTDMVQLQKHSSTGQLPLTVSASLEVESLKHEGTTLRAGTKLVAIDGAPIGSLEEFNEAVAASAKQSVLVTLEAPIGCPVAAVLNKMFEMLTLPEMDLVPKCSLYEAPLLNWLAKVLVQCLLKTYISKKVPPGTTEEAIIAQRASEFATADPASPLLKEAEEVADKAIQALPTPMDAKCLYFLLADVKRLQNPALKPPDVPLKPSYDLPQERVLAYLAALAHEGSDKEKLLKDALSDLEKDPNAELCARLADRAMTEPAFPKCAVQACQIAKGLETASKLGIKSTMLTKHVVGDASATDKKKAPDKGKKQSITGPIEMVPPPPPTATEFTWYCHVLLQSGRALVALVDPKSQEKVTQVELRKKALEDFSLATAYALKGRPEQKASSLLQAIKLYHCVAQPFATAVVTRAVMQESLTRLVGTGIPAVNVGSLEDDDHTVLLELYLFLIQTLRERAEYDRGLAVMQQAFQQLPRTQHKPLWEADVQFRCKMGQTAMKVKDKLRGVKGYDPPTQARTWIMFSRCVSEPAEQLYGLRQAVEALECEPEAQAAALASLAVWMFTRGRPSGDCVDVLHYAADKITDIVDSGWCDDDKATTATGARSQTSFAPTTTKRTSTMGSSQMQTTASSRLGGTTVATEHFSGPGVQQLLTLGTVYTLLAVLTGETHPEYYLTLQMAVTHFTQTLNITQKGLEHRKQSWGVSKKKATQDKAALVPLFTAPKDLVDYIGWELPEEVATYLISGKGDKRILSPHTIDDVNYLLSIVGLLLRMLRKGGLGLHVVGILCFEAILLPMTSLHHVALKHCLARNQHEKVMAYKDLSLAGVAQECKGSTVFGELSEETRRELLEDLKEVLLNPPVPAVYELCGDVELVVSSATVVHKAWIRQCEVLMGDMCIGSAAVLVREALLHAEAWKASKDIAQCNAILASIALWEGRYAMASGLIAKTLEVAPMLDSSTAIDLLLMRTKLLLLTDTAPETVLSTTAIAESKLTDASAKSDFLRGYVQLISEHYNGLLDPTLPEGYMGFIRAALQKAEEYCAERGMSAVQIKLLMISMQEEFFAQTTLRQTPDSLRLAKVMLNDQHSVLKGCFRLCRDFADDTTPSPCEVHSLRIVTPVSLAAARSMLALSKNILRRCVINCLLRRMRDLSPSVAFGAHDKDDETSKKVNSFLQSEVGLQFMSQTKKQRGVREELRERAKRREARYKELEAAWAPLPPEPPTPSPSKRSSNATEPSHDGDAQPTDADRKAWHEQAARDVPSDDGSSTSSDDSETETRDVDRRALYVEGCEEDYYITPHDACSLSSNALSMLAEGSYMHAEGCLRYGEALRAVIESTANTSKMKKICRRGLEGKPLPTAVDDLWAEAAAVVDEPPPTQVETKPTKPSGKKAAKKDEPEPVPEPVKAKAVMESNERAKVLLVEALQKFVACDDWDKASDTCHEIARVCMATQNTAEAARHVVLAQSFAAAVYSLKIFNQMAPSQNRERVLLSRLAASRTSQDMCSELQAALERSSALYRGLRVWGADVAGSAKPPTSTAQYLTLHVGKRQQHLYVVLQTGGRPAMVTRCKLLLEDINELQAVLEGLDHDRVSYLNGDSRTEAHEAVLCATAADVAERMESIFKDVSQLLEPRLGSVGLVLCVDRLLLRLPFESMAVFRKVKMVTRDLSAVHYDARATRSDTKLKMEGLVAMYDCHAETEGALGKPFEKVKEKETGKVEGGVLIAPPSEALVRAAQFCTGVCVYLSPGRLCGDILPGHLAGTDVAASLRCFVVADLCLTPASHRRTSFADSRTRPSSLALQGPTTVAVLLLARGLLSLHTHQHHCTPSTATATVTSLITSIEKSISLHEDLQKARAEPPEGTRPWERCNMVSWGCFC